MEVDEGHTMSTLALLGNALSIVSTDDTTKAIHEPWGAHDTQVLIVAAIGILIVVALIVWVKLHAFLALTLGALFVGVASGIDLGKVTGSF
jgi:GntP family gluconate:H+ symporter